MFAPHHQAAADELVRVCRPGDTVALLSWTPGGFIGRMVAAMKPYVPPPGAPSRRPVARSTAPASVTEARWPETTP